MSTKRYLENAAYPAHLMVRAIEHYGLYVLPPTIPRDDVLLSLEQRTTAGGETFAAELGDVSQLVTWLIGVCGRQPQVEGYGHRSPGLGASPVLTLLRPAVGAGHADTMTWSADGQFVLVHIRHHSPDPSRQTAAHFARHELGGLLDWLAAAHVAMADRAQAARR